MGKDYVIATLKIGCAAMLLGLGCAALDASGKGTTLIQPGQLNKFMEIGTYFKAKLPNGSTITVGAKHVCVGVKPESREKYGAQVLHKTSDICLLPELNLVNLRPLPVLISDRPVRPNPINIYHYSVLPGTPAIISGTIGQVTNYVSEMLVGTTLMAHVLITTNLFNPGDSGSAVFILDPNVGIRVIGVASAIAQFRFRNPYGRPLKKSMTSLFNSEIVKWMKITRTNYKESINVE